MDGNGIASTARPVVVTGAGGFIGRQLVPALVDAGYRVRAVSRAASAGRLQDRIEQLPHPGTSRGADWKPILAGAQAVVHLAGLAHMPVDDRATRRRLREVNVLATAELAAAAATAGVRDFVFMSSIKAVADRSAVPLAEDHRAAPEDCYGLAKRLAERRLWRLQPQVPGMRILVLRPPLVYGPGVGANFAALARLATAGLPLPLAAVRNRRSLVYVGNLVAAVLRCLNRSDVPSGTFHICDEAPVATPELVRAIAKAKGTRVHLFAVPPSLLHGAARLLGREAQAARLLGSLEVDGARFRAAFDWQPPFTLAQGLAMMHATPHGSLQVRPLPIPGIQHDGEERDGNRPAQHAPDRQRIGPGR